MLQKPSIGRIVHYNNNGETNAALVIAVHSDECVTLQSINAGGTWSTRTSCVLGDQPGQWSWPPKV